MPIRTQPRPLTIRPGSQPGGDGAYCAMDVAPVLLAENARRARFPGRCVLCPLPVLPGDRVARLPDGGEPVHVACAVRAPGVAR